MKTFPFFSFLLSTSLALAPFASASDSLVQLAPLDVTAERTPSLTVRTFAATAAELRLTPGATELVDAARFLRGRASTLEDTFFLSPGVIAQSRFGSDEARLSIRGSGLQRTFHGRGLRILQDGIPLNLADGSFDMQAIEPLAAAHVSVWRGANALALGASTLGGAIDYVSRTGRLDPPYFARLELGSWNYLRTGLAVGGVHNHLDAYASFTRASQDSFRDHARQENHRLFSNFGLRHSPAAETRLFFTAVRTDSELPGSLTKTQLRANPAQANPANLALHQKRNFDLLRLAGKTTVRTGDTTWNFSAAWSYKDLDHPIAQVVDQLSNDILLGASAIHTAEAHRLHAGFLLNRGKTQAANYTNTAGHRTTLVSSATQTATNLEAYIEDQLALTPRLTLILGASAATNRRESDQTFGATPDYSFSYHRLMPKLGLRYDTPTLQLYTNLSSSYEPPSFSETLTLSTPRRAQTATTFELGTRGTHGPLRWDLSVYHAALDHELLSLDHDNNPATPAATINARHTLHQGVELAFELDLLRTVTDTRSPPHRLVLRTAWTYNRLKFDDDPLYANNTLAGLPPHLIRGELTWETASHFYFGPTFELSPEKTYVDFRNTFAADPYAIAGFRCGYRPPRGLACFLEARNVFNKHYAATTGVIENAAATDQPQFLPGDARSLYAGLEYRW